MPMLVVISNYQNYGSSLFGIVLKIQINNLTMNFETYHRIFYSITKFLES